jgi:arylsulfatase A-like enzyme
VVSLIDLMPTLLGMAGIDEPEVLAECQGRDLMGAIRTGQFPEFAVSEVRRPNQTIWQRTVPGFMPEFRMRFDRALRSCRTNSHKYIWSSDGRHELFDLETDPGEERNLTDDQPELAAQMQGQLDTWLASFRHAETAEPTAAVDDQEVLRRLRDLGYIA